MKISEEMVKQIILEVLGQMQGAEGSGFHAGEDVPPMDMTEGGEAKPGTDRNEVVIGIPPAFGTIMTKTIIEIPHREVLRELKAGIEEEGRKAHGR